MRPLIHCKKIIDFYLDQFSIHCVQSFLSILYIEFHLVVFFDFINKSAYMYKCFFAGIVVPDKTEAFFTVEKLYGSGRRRGAREWRGYRALAARRTMAGADTDHPRKDPS